MANWVIQVGQKCEPLLELLWREIQSGPLINMDETTVQVLNEKYGLYKVPTTAVWSKAHV